MSELKRLVAFDGVDTEDSAKVKNWYDTEIIFRDPVTKEVWAKERNQVVLAGGDVVARKLFDLSEDDTDVIPTYNEELAIPDPGEEDPDAVYDEIVEILNRINEYKNRNNKTINKILILQAS